MLKFPEMPYERPDVEAAKQFLADAAARLDAAESFEAADAVFVEVDKYTTDLNTMFTIAHIRHDINTADEFYERRGGICRYRPARAAGVRRPLEPQPRLHPLEAPARGEDTAPSSSSTRR